MVNGADRQSVLVLERPVTVGQVLTPADLRQVTISADPGVATVPASEISSVVGKPVAVSLPEGVLLTPAAIGPATRPDAGTGVAALALQPGQFPPELAAGARVRVVFVPETATNVPPDDATTDANPSWPATVTSVTPRPNEQVTVVSVQMDEQAAIQVAAVPSGRLAVVMTSGEEG